MEKPLIKIQLLLPQCPPPFPPRDKIHQPMNCHIFDTHWPNNAISYHLQPADTFLTIKCHMSDRITFIGSITPQTWGEKEGKTFRNFKMKTSF